MTIVEQSSGSTGTSSSSNNDINIISSGTQSNKPSSSQPSSSSSSPSSRHHRHRNKSSTSRSGSSKNKNKAGGSTYKQLKNKEKSFKRGRSHSSASGNDEGGEDSSPTTETLQDGNNGNSNNSSSSGNNNQDKEGYEYFTPIQESPNNTTTHSITIMDDNDNGSEDGICSPNDKSPNYLQLGMNGRKMLGEEKNEDDDGMLLDDVGGDGRGYGGGSEREEEEIGNVLHQPVIFDKTASSSSSSGALHSKLSTQQQQQQEQQQQDDTIQFGTLKGTISSSMKIADFIHASYPMKNESAVGLDSKVSNNNDATNCSSNDQRSGRGINKHQSCTPSHHHRHRSRSRSMRNKQQSSTLSSTTNTSSNNSSSFANATANNSNVLREEYNVDHSCSTPLERLARDVGNALRKWHVHKGCDAHVSLDWKERMEDRELAWQQDKNESSNKRDGSNKGSNLNNSEEEDAHAGQMPSMDEGDVSMLGMSRDMSMSDIMMANDSDGSSSSSDDNGNHMNIDQCALGFRDRTQQMHLWMKEESAQEGLMERDEIPSGINVPTNNNCNSKNKLPPQSPPSPANARSKQSGIRKSSRGKCHDHGARCIRSEKIHFQTIGYAPESGGNTEDSGVTTWNRRRYNIPLVLKLWDAPSASFAAVFDGDDIMSNPWDNHVVNDSVDVGCDDNDGRRNNSIPQSLRPSISPSSYSLLGELGILSECGTQRPFYNPCNPTTATSLTETDEKDFNHHSLSSLTTGLTRDISSLFDIGQHITLCLDLTELSPHNSSSSSDGLDKNKSDVESLYADIHEYIEHQLHEALEARDEAIRERRRRWKKRQRLLIKRRRRMSSGRHHLRDCKKGTNHKKDNNYDVVGVGSQSKSSDMEVEEDDDDHNMAGAYNHRSDKKDASLDEYGFDINDPSYNDDDDSDGSDNNSGSSSEYDNDSSSNDDDNDDHSLHRLLDPRAVHAEVASSLASILQTALNLAASENECGIPVFGIWGDYHGDEHGSDGGGAATSKSCSWIPMGLERDVLQLGDYGYNAEIGGYGEEDEGEDDDSDEHDHHYNSQRLLLSSPALSGTCQMGSFRSLHRLYFVPSSRRGGAGGLASSSSSPLPLHLSTLNGLANVLLAQCPHSSSQDGGGVVLSAARHCYRWEQCGGNEQLYGCHADGASEAKQSWRLVHNSLDNNDDVIAMPAVEAYRQQCRQQALLILERASSPSVFSPIPIWGPAEGNPLMSLTASVSWGVITPNTQDGSNNNPPPLLQLPLKIRSCNFASTPSELLDMEYALQAAALNPIGMGISEKDGGRHHEFGPREPIFYASASFDADAPCATLSANTRCVLAALVRCGSLGMDALPGHLTKKEILANFSGGSSRREGANHDENFEDKGVKDKYLTDTERILRKAMDLANVGPVTRRLIDALDWKEIDVDLSAAEFDRAIAEALRRIQSTTYPTPPVEVFSIMGDTINATAVHQHVSGNEHWCQGKGSPPGRLLSVLFEHMARLRTPPSMMRLWLSFVEELRTRWDHNESLPNLGFVPGLDNNGDTRHDQPHWGLRKADTRVLGHRADHAAFVNSSEPDPDRNHCIINQKLQVYNISLECKMSTEALHDRMQSNDYDHDSLGSDDRSISEKYTSDIDDEEFFDPEEEEVAFDASPDRNQGNHHSIERMLMAQASVMSPHHNRVGARCPVPDGVPLIQSGDQLYAPYLQRTMPMTDEEEQKQKKFLGVSKNNMKGERPSIKSRIAIAQRLQKPKLLSDMSSFKAANVGAVFEDFVRWYGNPRNVFMDDGQTTRQALEYRANLPPDEAKTLALEEASEAIAILMSLRAFWEDTWEEAEPCPAFEQEPLFDPYSTMEMVLHSFETVHPALLLNQVLAVKLSNATFVLESAAAPAGQVHSVARGLAYLKKAVDVALEALTKDAADGFLHLAPKNTADESDPLVYVSTSTIAACEEACNTIGEFEILLTRVLSLLQKIPGEYELVDSLLQCKDGRFLFMEHPRKRSAILGAIRRHQNMVGSDVSPEASPVMREYVLRSLDPSNPCQLSARLVSDFDQAQPASMFQGSLLMALTKSCQG